MTPPTVSVVLVNWNAATLIGECLDTLLAQSIADSIEVIVVDNASSDNSAEVLERFTSRGVRTHYSDVNLGFGRACNLGARLATGELLFFLNPDTALPWRDCLERLVQVLASDTRVGLVGPRLLYPDGSTQIAASQFPTIGNSLLIGLGAHFLLPDRARAHLVPTHWSQGWSRSVDWLRGAALLLRAETFWDVGGFSEATFMYVEDLELAYEIRRRGLTVRYETTAELVHYDDHSADQRWTYGERAAKVAQAELAFMRRHYAFPRRAVIRAIWAVAYGLRSVLFAVLRKTGKSRAYLSMMAIYGGVRR